MADTATTSTRRRRRPWLVALTVVLVLGVVAAGVLAWYLHRIDRAVSQVKRTQLMSGTPRPYEPGRPLTFVLMGSDTRAGGSLAPSVSDSPGDARSDSLIVAYVSGDRTAIYLISFPRDMYVDIPGHGKAKINAAYALGGPPLVIETLERLTGTPMDHAAVIDFEGFIKLTDSLGGVTVSNKVASKNPDGNYTWPQGTITLHTGKEALSYVRQRHGLPNGDLDRAERQRAVVKAIIGKVISAGTLTNPDKFSATLDQISACVTVDQNLSNDTIKRIATDLRVRGADDIVSLQAPISGFGKTSDGQDVDVVDEGKMTALGTAMQTDTMAEYVQKYGG